MFREGRPDPLLQLTYPDAGPEHGDERQAVGSLQTHHWFGSLFGDGAAHPVRLSSLGGGWGSISHHSVISDHQYLTICNGWEKIYLARSEDRAWPASLSDWWRTEENWLHWLPHNKTADCTHNAELCPLVSSPYPSLPPPPSSTSTLSHTTSTLTNYETCNITMLYRLTVKL